MSKFNRAVISAAVMAALAAGAVVGTAGTASAAEPGKLTVCSRGNYASKVTFNARGGFSTTVVASGKCTTLSGLGGRTGAEKITVWGFYNRSGSAFKIDEGQFRPSIGGTVQTFGTTAAGKHWASTPRI